MEPFLASTIAFVTLITEMSRAYQAIACFIDKAAAIP